MSEQVQESSVTTSDTAGLGSFLTGLGAVIEGVRETHVRMDRVAATQFSVFRYFKRNENIISGIFADLLRTDGSHGQGDTFLRLFLEELDRGRDDDARYRQAAEYELARGSFVDTEHVIGGKRRIDIVVRLGEGRKQWLVVENKPWAGEQENQLADYAAYVHERERDPRACVVYVSGDGSHSDTIPEEKRAHYRTVSYRQGGKAADGPSIERWIRRCVERCEADRVRWFLMDMHRYIREVFQNEEEQEDE
ncbi:MAG: hypothetical protein F4X81_12230 [Gammaproteobacteria bacterium]|nr:hypothetical protein [Gammaproteobacteria bacterium]MYF49321.1 hypothetical protein [Gammaproteobacteria bacterium]